MTDTLFTCSALKRNRLTMQDQLQVQSISELATLDFSMAHSCSIAVDQKICSSFKDATFIYYTLRRFQFGLSKHVQDVVSKSINLLFLCLHASC